MSRQTAASHRMEDIHDRLTEITKLGGLLDGLALMAKRASHDEAADQDYYETMEDLVWPGLGVIGHLIWTHARHVGQSIMALDDEPRTSGDGGVR